MIRIHTNRNPREAACEAIRTGKAKPGQIIIIDGDYQYYRFRVTAHGHARELARYVV